MENGSFLSEDSYLGTKSEPLTRNRYAYVSNNPVNYVDPSGYLLEEIEQWASDTWNNLKELGGGLWSAGKDIGNAALNLAKDAYDFGIQELEALRTGKPLKSVESAKKVAADPAKAVIEIQQKVSQSKLGQAVQDYGEVQINHVVVQAGIQAELIEAEKEAMQPVCDWIEENEEAVKIGIGSTVMLGTGIATVFTGVAAPFCIGSVIGGFSGGIIHAIFAEEDKFGAFADGFMWGSIIGAVSPAIGSLITSLGGTYAILKVPAVAMALEGFLETCMEELAIIMQGGDVNLGMFLGDWALNSFTSGSNPQMAKLTEWLEGVFERGRQFLKNLFPEIEVPSGKPIGGNYTDDVIEEGLEGGSNFSTKNIDEFLNGNKSFDDVIDDYAKIYADNVNSNQIWSWDDAVPGGDSLSKKQRSLIKQQAIDNGLIPEIQVTKVDGMKYGFADFESAGVVKETVYLPEEMWKMSDAEQFKWLNEQIGGAMEGYTWHHTEVPGKMQLVPTGIHNITTHNGGRTTGMWADASR